MSLIVEDGSRVENANTYNSVAEAKAFADLRGSSFTVSDSQLEGLLIQAMEVLESYDFVGALVSEDQALSWPRKGVRAHGRSYAADVIPPRIQNAQVFLALQAQEGPLQPAVTGASVRRRKVGPLETEFFEGTDVRTPYITSVERSLEGFLRHTGQLPTERGL